MKRIESGKIIMYAINKTIGARDREVKPSHGSELSKK